MTAGLLVFVAGAGLILDTSTSRVVAAYVVLAAIVARFAAPSTFDAPHVLALFLVSFVLKLVVMPLGIWTFVHRNAAARNLRPAVGLPLRLITVLAIGVGSQLVMRIPALAAIPMNGTVAYVVLCGLAVLVIHRSLLAQVVGLLVFDTGVTLAGVVSAPGLPQSFELGAAFDALIVTFIGLALARAFLKHVPLLDIESLRSLRG